MKKTLILALLLSGCKTAEQHLEKFHEKGGVVKCDTDTLRIETFVKGKDGKDSLVYRDSIITKYQTTVQTKWQTRFDNKRFKDSLKVTKQMYQDSLKYALKNNKVDSKQDVKEKKQDKKIARIESNGWRWYEVLGISLLMLVIGWIARWLYVKIKV